MNEGKIVLAQIFEYLPKRDFQRCVEKYGGNKGVKTFSCWDQFLCLAFAQLTYRESLRDIETCLRAIGKKLYHLGIRGSISKPTLADANNKRSWLIYYEFAQIVMGRARKLYGSEKEEFLNLRGAAYCLDASVIDVCLSLFPWAHYTNQHQGRAAIKLHTLLDLQSKIPSFFSITPAKTYELEILDSLLLEAGAFYILDRGYFDWRRLDRINESSAFFVIRAKRDTRLRRLYSQKVSIEAKEYSGVQSDHIVISTSAESKYLPRKYPNQLRRIRVYDKEKQRSFIFLTNNFLLPAETISHLYKARWHVELFFKWIKQHLRIKTFYGNSQNSVKTQICVAITVYALIAIVKKSLKLQQNLYTVLQILSVTAIEKTPILSLFPDKNYNSLSLQDQKQLNLPI